MKGARLRVLLFSTSIVRGGVEEVILALAQGLDPREFDVHLAAPRQLLESFQPDLDDCPAKTLAIRLDSWKKLGDIRRFLGYLRRERIQIVNSHLFRATLFAAPLARLAGVPVVIETTHGPEAWRRSWWKRKCWLDRVIELFVSANIAVSEANREYLVNYKRYPARKIRVAPNGRDLARYGAAPESALQQLRRQFGLSSADRVLVVVGRLEEQKGHRDLLEILPDLVQRFPRLRVIFVGEGSLRHTLEHSVASAGLSDNVIFAGFSRQVSAFYSLAEFVVLPSRYEGLPLVAIEAGAAGRALVATAVDGTREVIVSGQTGLLAPPDLPALLGEAIAQLLENPARAQEMGRAARARVEQLFSLETQLQKTAQVYRECLALAGV
jgi:glycosyltransferase involved in cell wall biosynthesis